MREGYCERCSAWWPPPVTFPFLSEPSTLTLFPLFTARRYFFSCLFPLASSSPKRQLSWHQKRKWQQVCLWFPLEWQRLMENTHLKSFDAGKILPGCARLLHPKAASCPMDIKCTQCSALRGVKSAEGSWAVEKGECLVLSWGTEFAGKKSPELFWCHQYSKKGWRKALLSLVKTPLNGMRLHEV